MHTPLSLHRVAVCSVLAVLSSLPVHADIIIQTPSGLQPGDQFRIVFVTTNTISATSSDISTYNNFVADQAIFQAGGIGSKVLYQGTSLAWKAIGSTDSVSAMSNVGTYGVPVYLASGVQVSSSDGLSGLFSGSIENPINQGLVTDSPYWDDFVWTGSTTDGQSYGSFTLGGSFGNTIFGKSMKTNNEWINETSLGSDNQSSVYGLSQALTVSAVPEPSAWLLAALGAACTAACRRLRCRRSPARHAPPSR